MALAESRVVRLLVAIGLLGCCALPAQTAPTIQASARLVVVDVTVIDRNGNPVHGLKPSDFHLLEDKTPQTVRNFEEHTAAPAAASPTAAAKLEPGVYTNAVSSTGAGPANILLLDMLNTPLASQSLVRAQLLKYLMTAKPGTKIAIFALTSKLILLQGFTGDTEMLRLAVAHAGTKTPAVMGDKVGSGQNRTAELSAEIGAQLSVSPEMLEAVTEFAADEKEVDGSLTAQLTLSGMNQLARYLGGIPGRKNLMWFSASFPIDMLGTHRRAGLDPFAGSQIWERQYRETVDLLAKNRVAVYPIDARGLMVAPLGFAARSFSTPVFETQSTMWDLAEGTGGKAFTNTNGLAQAVAEVVENGASYYTLSYTPTNANAHGEYRSIQVQVDGGSYKLGYRRGYDANANDTPSPASMRLAMKTAARYGAPAATQIPFFARVLPAEDTPVAARVELTKGRTVRYRVEYSTDPRGLAIATAPDGTRHGHLEFVALVFDAEGKTINSDVKAVRAAWTPAQFAAAQTRGIRYEQEIAVPAKGRYNLRVMVHDLESDAIGTIDVALGR